MSIKRRHIHLSKKYILDLLAEIGMLDYNLADNPTVTNHDLQIIEGEPMEDREKYQIFVEKMIYLSHMRPNISYAVGVVSRFMECPQKSHREAVYKISVLEKDG